MLSPAFLFLYASPLLGSEFEPGSKALDYMPGSAGQQVFRLTSQARVAPPWLLVVSSEHDSGSLTPQSTFPPVVYLQKPNSQFLHTPSDQKPASPQISLNSSFHISAPGPWTCISF